MTSTIKITADTNILLRLAVLDDQLQAHAAEALLSGVELIAVPNPALCEFVWVLRKDYRFNRTRIVDALNELLEIPALRVDRAAVQAGIASLEAGGDFADACIAVEGRRLGGEVFTSFDRRAVALIKAAGGDAHLLRPSAGDIS